MAITILAVGRDRDGPRAALYREYVQRLPWPVRLIEVEERRPLHGAERIAREGDLLRRKLPPGAVVAALDEHGRTLSSREFATWLGRARDGGGEIAFLIGGADGLAPDLKATAALCLSLGPMTWPHLLVRALLAEQLYRASAILAGHPYHRD